MLCIIAAFSTKKRIIGKNGKIPWHIQEDLLYFKELTENNIVIFGRKTYEEIGKPLPNRINIVISNTKKFYSPKENLFTAKTLQEAVQIAKSLNEKKQKNIFICGGEQLYKESIFLAQKIFITEIKKTYSGDRFFPKIPKKRFKLKSRKKTVTKNGIKLVFKTYTKKR